MSKRDKGRVNPRTLMKVGVIAVIFFAGLIVGGGCSSSGGDVSRGDIMECLPLMDAAALDRCVAP